VFLTERPLKLICAAIARISLAAMLLLALLSGVAPFHTLSSAEQTCSMSCCAGKPAHAAGSCGTAFSDVHHGETTFEAHEHTGAMQMPSEFTEIIETASHCGTSEHSLEKGASPKRTSWTQAGVAARVLTTPCSPECAAVVLSASAQFRRVRDAAALPVNSRPRPPTLRSPAEHITSLQPSTATAGRQANPRAPPLLCKNLPA
jgi:hypothetical protein